MPMDHRDKVIYAGWALGLMALVVSWLLYEILSEYRDRCSVEIECNDYVYWLNDVHLGTSSIISEQLARTILRGVFGRGIAPQWCAYAEGREMVAFTGGTISRVKHKEPRP